jgi:hypothetical protein
LPGIPIIVERPPEWPGDSGSGSCRPLAPRRHDPGIPRDLETIVRKAINPEPRERYPSAMADDLRRFLAGRPIAARPASAVEQFVR